jgi:hypothetical protein
MSDIQSKTAGMVATPSRSIESISQSYRAANPGIRVQARVEAPGVAFPVRIGIVAIIVE